MDTDEVLKPASLHEVSRVVSTSRPFEKKINTGLPGTPGNMKITTAVMTQIKKNHNQMETTARKEKFKNTQKTNCLAVKMPNGKNA